MRAVHGLDTVDFSCLPHPGTPVCLLVCLAVIVSCCWVVYTQLTASRIAKRANCGESEDKTVSRPPADMKKKTAGIARPQMRVRARAR